jgi:hypothetical protein
MTLTAFESAGALKNKLIVENCDSQHNATLVMLSVTKQPFYAECRHGECCEIIENDRIDLYLRS